MANSDPRALLRAERITRRITHPQASYTKDGKLLCNLCELPIKSENAWKTHLHSTGHTLRLSRAHDVEIARRNGSEQMGTKKRKADSLESPVREDRKKARPGLEQEEAVSISQQPSPPEEVSAPASTLVEEEKKLDEEYAAFEREMAVLDSTLAATSALNAAATISAAPMSVADIAAQAREEQSAQRGKRDVEIEGEREDAARLMADELDEMDDLEERVKKLRERRDALRSGETRGGDTDVKPHDVVEPVKVALRQANNDNRDDADDDDNDVEVGEDEDDDADFNDWNFGAT